MIILTPTDAASLLVIVLIVGMVLGDLLGLNIRGM